MDTEQRQDDANRFADYYIQMTDARLERMEGKIDELLGFKWTIIGGSVVVSTILSILISIGLAYASK